METRTYNRERALQYAKKWALSRNPLFYDFKGIGGDCTSFVSQCLYAGCCAMNFTDTFGWYYATISNRSPAWTGVPYLYNFLTGNTGVGPYGVESGLDRLEIGDIIQLGRSDGTFYHSLIITGHDKRGYLVSSHSNDAYNRRLSSYQYQLIRAIHILGYRSESSECDCFTPLYRGTELVIC